MSSTCFLRILANEVKPILIISLTNCGTDRSFGVKRIFNAVRLPRNHADCKGLVYKLSIRISAGFVQCHADVSSCPWRSCVSIANTTHIPSLKILLALFTDWQATVWKLYIQGLFEPRRCEGQDILEWLNSEIKWRICVGFSHR